jgi:hypothetical protein
MAKDFVFFNNETMGDLDQPSSEYFIKALLAEFLELRNIVISGELRLKLMDIVPNGWENEFEKIKEVEGVKEEIKN